MANIEIDGKKMEAEPGSMIIEAADKTDIWIPRFCYHKKLSIAANCRMCLVEVEKSPKPLPACATPITEGMKIWTRSPKALLAQKAVMEFLLINHPLDCPICDQGGECELQDIAMGYGSDVSQYTEGKRSVKDKDLGPLISSDMTRCIQCTRCVRFGSEVAGMRELGALGRGEQLEIGTFIEKNIDSEVSGNVIEICPVGALTSKPFRFKARAWELKQAPSISPHDCVGTNIFVHTRRNEVMRIVPRENENINEVWISDRDRYSYEALNHERLSTPKIKIKGQFQAVSWEEAIDYTAEKLKVIVQQYTGKAISALASPNSTTEEFYLLQKWMRSLGSHNLDHRLRQTDFRNQQHAPAFLNLGLPIHQLEKQSAVLLVGSLLRQEQPLLALKLRKMTLADGKVCVVNPLETNFNFEVAHKKIIAGNDLVSGLAGIAKAVINDSSGKIPPGVSQWLSNIEPSAIDIEIAHTLKQSEKSSILLGSLALHHKNASDIIALGCLISELLDIRLGTLTEGANSAGAYLTGFVPHRLAGGRANIESGFNVNEMWESSQKAFVLLGLEPHLDCAASHKAIQALQAADCVVMMTAFDAPLFSEFADVLLPIAPFTENSGTFINIEGCFQSFKPMVCPKGDSKEAWKVLRVLANRCQIAGFEYTTVDEVLQEFKETVQYPLLEHWDWSPPLEFPSPENNIMRISPVPLYASDGLVRRSASLQKMKAAGTPIVRINPVLGLSLQLQNGELYRIEMEGVSVLLPVVFDDAIPLQAVCIPQALPETMGLGGFNHAVFIHK